MKKQEKGRIWGESGEDQKGKQMAKERKARGNQGKKGKFFSVGKLSDQADQLASILISFDP